MYCGIDNGLDGGIVLLDNVGGIYDALPMPTVKKGKGREVDVEKLDRLVSLITKSPVNRFVVEEASKHSAGTLALCSTWFTYGSILAVLRCNQARFETVRPQQWQKAFWTRPKMAKGEKFDTKAAALHAAGRIWPSQDWTPTERARKPHDGMIDAALIAEYGRRNNF